MGEPDPWDEVRREARALPGELGRGLLDGLRDLLVHLGLVLAGAVPGALVGWLVADGPGAFLGGLAGAVLAVVGFYAVGVVVLGVEGLRWWRRRRTRTDQGG